MPVRRIKVSKGEVQSRKVEMEIAERKFRRSIIWIQQLFVCGWYELISNFLLQAQFNTFLSFKIMTTAKRNVRIYWVYFEINSIKFYRLFIVNAIWKLSKHKSRGLKLVHECFTSKNLFTCLSSGLTVK